MNRNEAIKLRNAIVCGSVSLPNEIAATVPNLFNTWQLNKNYEINDRVRYGTLLYKCIQAHTSQSGWAPDVAVSLWVRADESIIEWPEWRQPTGAQDAYMNGDKVSHNEKHWISQVDNNVWEPGAIGTETLWIEN